MTSAELATLAADVAGQIWEPDKCAIEGIWGQRQVELTEGHYSPVVGHRIYLRDGWFTIVGRQPSPTGNTTDEHSDFELQPLDGSENFLIEGWKLHDRVSEAIQPGRTVHILGSGPSAAGFLEQVVAVGSGEFADGGTWDMALRPTVIACNAAIRLCPAADIWLTSERSVHLHDWFAAGAGFRGIPIMEWGITQDDPARSAVDPDLFPEAFWRRVLWHRRFCLGYDDQQPCPLVWEHDFREPHGGLAVIQDQTTGIAEALGTVTSRALQIAMLAGASHICFWGCELMFAGNRQYATDDVAYTGPDPHDAHTNGEIEFFIDSDSEPAQFTRGDYEPIAGVPLYRTTRLMFHSSVALRAMLERCTEQGLTWEDRSGGLLEPARLDGIEAQVAASRLALASPPV